MIDSGLVCVCVCVCVVGGDFSVEFACLSEAMADSEGVPQPKKKNLNVEPGAGPSSLFILSDTNYLRRFTMFLIEWPPFEYTVLLTIIGKKSREEKSSLMKTKVRREIRFIQNFP